MTLKVRGTNNAFRVLENLGSHSDSHLKVRIELKTDDSEQLYFAEKKKTLAPTAPVSSYPFTKDPTMWWLHIHSCYADLYLIHK